MVLLLFEQIKHKFYNFSLTPLVKLQRNGNVLQTMIGTNILLDNSC